MKTPTVGEELRQALYDLGGVDSIVSGGMDPVGDYVPAEALQRRCRYARERIERVLETLGLEVPR